MAIVKRQVGFQAGLHVRAAGEGEAPSRTIEGYALKFGVRSKLLSDWWTGSFYEILEPGCLTRQTLDNCDIKLTMFHDRELILARSKEGAGTLSYEVDDVGVRFWAEMPNTDDGNKALELVQRGDIDGCSFIYSTDESDSVNCVQYERLNEKDRNGDPVLLRHVLRIDKVYDFTVTPDPAFEQTTVSRREVEATGVTVGEPVQEQARQEPAVEEPPAPTIDYEKKRAVIKGLRDAARGA